MSGVFARARGHSHASCAPLPCAVLLIARASPPQHSLVPTVRRTSTCSFVVTSIITSLSASTSSSVRVTSGGAFVPCGGLGISDVAIVPSRRCASTSQVYDRAACSRVRAAKLRMPARVEWTASGARVRHASELTTSRVCDPSTRAERQPSGCGARVAARERGIHVCTPRYHGACSLRPVSCSTIQPKAGNTAGACSRLVAPR